MTATGFKMLMLISLAANAVALTDELNGQWDAVLNLDVRIPFRMDVQDSPPRVCFFEGSEPLCSTSAELTNGELTARWDYMRIEVRLIPKDEELQGTYARDGARLGPKITAIRHRPPIASVDGPVTRVGGTWEMHSTEKAWVSWRLLLEQTGAELKGTVLEFDGDLGTFTGRIEGTHFFMSHFAGDRPLVLNGNLLPDETLDIEIAGGVPKTRYYALRPDKARIRGLKPPADPRTDATVKNPEDIFLFRFPDLAGRQVSEKDFSGNPFLVSITGSWCSNCRDEAAFLTEIFQRYGPKGLGMVGFCFERSDDPANELLKAFVRKFHITYPMLLAGEPGDLKKALPQIEKLGSFPTTIFVAADGRIRLIHAGFPGTASGAERLRVEKEFRNVVEAILSDKVKDR